MEEHYVMSQNEKISYQKAGVDIDEGNLAVKLMKKHVHATFDDNVVGEIGLFSGAYSLKDFLQMEEPTLLSATDGVGTKVMIAQELGIDDTVGIDLVAMSVNDLICQGAKPLFFLDYIATGKVKAEQIATIVKGIAEGCKQSHCALIGGETAEMAGLYNEGEYDLAGFAVGICDRSKIITGKDVQVGDVVIGISSSGLHSNGYSLARRLFFDELGYSMNHINDNGKTIGELLLEPTRIYVEVIEALLKDCTLKSIAHITGGGLLENVPRVIPEGLGVKIDVDSFEKPDIFKYIIASDKVETNELYRTFNMGIGMVVVVKKEDVSKVLEIANQYFKTYQIGEVVTEVGVNLCNV